MIIHTFHPRSSLHFTSLHFTSLSITALHCTLLLIFYFPALLDVSSPPFKNPSILLTYIYFPNPLSNKICDIQGKVASSSAGCWFHSLIVLFTKKYLAISVLCFLAYDKDSNLIS